MDFIDLIVDTSEEYLTGYFYFRRPKTPDDGRITFKYKQLNPNSRVFDTVLGNIRADRATYAIKSNDHCGFNVGGYVITQNGLIWEIVEVIRNEEVKGSNDALRWFTRAVNTECSVRMIQIDDLFDQNDAYTTDCEITVTSDIVFTYFNAVKSLTGEIIPSDINGVIDGKRKVLSVPKGTAVTITYSLVTMEGTKKMQIPSFSTVENTIDIKIDG